MLAELLERPFFRRRLFPKASLPEKLLIEREKKFPGHNDRYDLALFSPDPEPKLLLLLENKFKSLPSAPQLEKYDKILKAYPEAVKYLLVFRPGAPGERAAEARGWNILTYRELSRVIREYLAAHSDLQDKWTMLLAEYADFLDGYISRYDGLIANPALLNGQRDDPDYKFFRRLFMGNLAARLNEKFPELEISDNSGGAQEPLLDIYPPSWNRNSGGKWPRIFIQLQGDKIKFYLRWREAGEKMDRKNKLKEEEKEKILDYIRVLKGLDGINLNLIENRLNGNSASCSICSRPFISAGSMEDCVEQAADFYRRIDRAVKERGLFY